MRAKLPAFQTHKTTALVRLALRGDVCSTSPTRPVEAFRKSTRASAAGPPDALVRHSCAFSNALLIRWSRVRVPPASFGDRASSKDTSLRRFGFSNRPVIVGRSRLADHWAGTVAFRSAATVVVSVALKLGKLRRKGGQSVGDENRPASDPKPSPQPVKMPTGTDGHDQYSDDRPHETRVFPQSDED